MSTKVFHKIIFIAFLLALPTAIFAVGFTDPITNASLTNLILVVLSAMWKIFFGIAVVFFVIAGIQFLTAQGNAEQIKLARNSVIYGVIGIIVATNAFNKYVLTSISQAISEKVSKQCSSCNR